MPVTVNAISYNTDLHNINIPLPIITSISLYSYKTLELKQDTGIQT